MADIDKEKMNETKNDLGLDKIIIDNVPDDILFPDELITYLRGQIQVTKHLSMNTEA